MSAFVGSRQATAEQLKALVEHPAIALASSYYFLRWFHKVSGIQMNLPDDFPSPEGQLFNAALELRWKQRGATYEVLLLSKAEPDAKLGFSPLRLLCTHKWSLSEFPSEEDRLKLPQTMHQSRHPRRALRTIP